MKNEINRNIFKKHKEALEHEKNFWLETVPKSKYKLMQKDWINTAIHFESIVTSHNNLSEASNILQIGSAVQDVISYWRTGRRFSVDPLSIFYKENFNVYDEGLCSVTALGENLPFKDSSINVLLCMNVLDHTSDPEQCINECRRVLHRNGLFFLGVDVYPEGLVDSERDDPIHLWQFTSHEIIALLTKIKFTILEKTLNEKSESEDTQWFWLALKKSNE